MENAEEVLQSLDSFSKLRPKDIPRELEEYLCFVARTGDPVYHWSIIKSLFREKLLHVLTEFHDSTPGLDLPLCPNVDQFNYDTMKNCLLERIESFSSAPFTVQRICELLTSPRKQYSRIDKYMRAIEKNILVVSTREPGNRDSESGDPLEAVLNGDGFDMHIEIEMDGNLAWKEAPTAAECPVTTNDTSYSIATDSSNGETSLNTATNCQSDTNKPLEGDIDLNIENDSLKEQSTAQDESVSTSEPSENQSMSELLSTCANVNVEESSTQELDSSEQNSVETNCIDIESTGSSIPVQPILESFALNNETEESIDTSETDSNLSESITSELQESGTSVEETTLVTPDVENSNDGIPFPNVQNEQEPVIVVHPVEVIDTNDLQQVLENNDAPLCDAVAINNCLGEKQEHDKIESNMEKLFQIVCETTIKPSVDCTNAEDIEHTVENDVEIKPIITEPDEAQENLELKESVPPIEADSVLICETEPEHMVDVVENDCNVHCSVKVDESITEPVADQIESMDIPESAMEVEDTPVTSEPMDQ